VKIENISDEQKRVNSVVRALLPHSSVKMSVREYFGREDLRFLVLVTLLLELAWVLSCGHFL
jgi:hypothetical protein